MKKQINKIGKIGKRNIDANKRLREMFDSRDIRFCELGLDGCDNFILQFCHRHKRLWYRDKPELLYCFKQVVIGCQSCHEKIEKDKSLTEKMFLLLRGQEDV